MPFVTCRFAAVGECMMELLQHSPNEFRIGFAGDTYNVCVYLARCSDLTKVQVEYITALGDDPYSQMMVEAWKKEHIGHRYVRKITGKLPGLYIIRTDDRGERHFYYYRSQSAARNIFIGLGSDTLFDHLLEFDYLYLSGISLAILDSMSLQKLWRVLKKARQKGSIICFDSNYRPILWSSRLRAQKAIETTLRLVDIALPSFDDEHLLFDDDSMEACVRRHHSYGVREVVVKKGSKGYLLSTPAKQQFVHIPPVRKVIDTTAAGDSFNGAYLASRIKAMSMEEAAHYAARVSAVVVQHQGAIIPFKNMPAHSL